MILISDPSKYDHFKSQFLPNIGAVLLSQKYQNIEELDKLDDLLFSSDLYEVPLESDIFKISADIKKRTV